MKTLLYSALLICISFAPAVYASSVDNPSKVKEVVSIAERYSASNADRLENYYLRSLTLYKTEFNGMIDKSRTDKYAANFFKTLKGKEYWAVCYQAKMEGVGGVLCVFVENSSSKPLLIYRGK